MENERKKREREADDLLCMVGEMLDIENELKIK